MRLHPALFFGVLNVHIFNTDGAAICIAQNMQQLTQSHAVCARHSASEKFAIQVPNCQSVSCWIKFNGQFGLFPMQRINICDEMTTHTMNTDQGGDLHLLIKHGLFMIQWVDVSTPLHGLIRHTHALKYCLIKTVLTQQQFVHPLQEESTLGALNNSVVIGAGDRHDLRDTQSS